MDISESSECSDSSVGSDAGILDSECSDTDISYTGVGSDVCKSDAAVGADSSEYSDTSGVSDTDILDTGIGSNSSERSNSGVDS